MLITAATYLNYHLFGHMIDINDSDGNYNNIIL